jgi:hypothetical protein
MIRCRNDLAAQGRRNEFTKHFGIAFYAIAASLRLTASKKRFANRIRLEP